MQSREAERRGVEQRSALRMLGAPRRRGARGGAAERAVAGSSRSGRRASSRSWMRTRSPHADPPAAPSPSGRSSTPARARSARREPHARTPRPQPAATGASGRDGGGEASRRRPAPLHSPNVLRSAPSASDRPTPIAASALLGSLSALWQAAPGGDREALVVEQRAERVAAQRRRSARGCGRAGARRRPRRSGRPGARRAARGLVRVADGRGRAGDLAVGDAPRERRGEPGGLRHALGARAAAPRSCPPPCSTVASVETPRPASTPAPLGPCSLCAGDRGGQLTGQLVESQGQPGRGLHGIEVQAAPRARRRARRSRARAGSRPSGCSPR